MNKEQNLISHYENLCIRWGASKNSRQANLLFDKIRKVEHELKQTEQGIQELLLDLKHAEGFVRLNASFALLNIYPNEAENTLEKLLKEHGHLGFSAEITLEEWRKGTLNIQ